MNTACARNLPQHFNGCTCRSNLKEVAEAQLGPLDENHPFLNEAAEWLGTEYVHGIDWIHPRADHTGEVRDLNEGATTLRRHLMAGDRDGLTALEAAERYLEKAHPESYRNDPVYPHVLERVVEERTAQALSGTEIEIQAAGGHHVYTDGVLHAANRPAVVMPGGHEEWRQRGNLHRTDGPAFTDRYGRKEFHVDGRLHRTEGPAVSRPDGGSEWWVDGNRKNMNPRGPISIQRVERGRLVAKYVDANGDPKWRRVPPQWMFWRRLPGLDDRRAR